MANGCADTFMGGAGLGAWQSKTAVATPWVKHEEGNRYPKSDSDCGYYALCVQ